MILRYFLRFRFHRDRNEQYRCPILACATRFSATWLLPFPCWPELAADNMIENVGSSQYTFIIPHRVIQLVLYSGSPRQGCASHKSTNKQIPSEASEEPSDTVIHFFSSSLLWRNIQPIRGNDRWIGRMFPGRTCWAMDPEYSFAEYFQLGSRRNIRPIKNGLVLNWTNVCSPEHTSDTSTNYDSFLNWTFSSPNMVRTVQTLLHSQLACNEMQASARTCGWRAADSMIENVGWSQVSIL